MSRLRKVCKSIKDVHEDCDYGYIFGHRRCHEDADSDMEDAANWAEQVMEAYD